AGRRRRPARPGRPAQGPLLRPGDLDRLRQRGGRALPGRGRARPARGRRAPRQRLRGGAARGHRARPGPGHRPGRSRGGRPRAGRPRRAPMGGRALPGGGVRRGRRRPGRRRPPWRARGVADAALARARRVRRRNLAPPPQLLGQRAPVGAVPRVRPRARVRGPAMTGSAVQGRPAWRRLEADWELARLDGRGAAPAGWMPARVPGAVQLDWARAHGLPDPFFGQNVRLYEGLEDYHWLYRTRVPPAALAPGEQLVFACGGVDYACEVRVAGRSALRHEGLFTGFEVDLTGCPPGAEIEVLVLPAPKRPGAPP